LKLLLKSTLYFLTIALFVLFMGGIVFYFSFRTLLNLQVKRELTNEMHQIILHPPRNNIYLLDSAFFNLQTHYQVIPIEKIINPNFEFRDTFWFDNIMDHYQSYRLLRYETNLYGKPVRISLSKSMLASDELIKYVAFITLLLSLFLLVFLVVFNRYFFSHLWGSFFATIEIIKDYNIADSTDIHFPESDITEFNLLNQVFEKMHERIKQDYQNLKEFTENISHEIQNPLAIINSKIDLLQQTENLSISQNKLIQSIQGNAIRLSNLNKSLILLSKIDNNQFPEKEMIDIAQIVNFHLGNFEDIIQSKHITLQKNYNNTVHILGDSNLIGIMLLNLLKNSIYHNLDPGTIEVTTEPDSLIIKNTGRKHDISHDDLFKRFIKSSDRSDSLGLGLAIVKKICEYYHFDIHYSYKNDNHIVKVHFI
jgi:signal transduction histidine kinase